MDAYPPDGMANTRTDSTAATISPPRRWRGLGLTELWDGRRILAVLSKRQFKAKYNSLALGFVWVILEPLLLTIIITLLLEAVLERGGRYGLPFPVFLFTGWIALRVWSRLVTSGGSSIKGNKALVERIYLPRAFFPLSEMVVSFVDFAAMVVALLALLFYYGISPGIGMLALPLLVAIMFAFGMGLAFFFSAASLRAPDLDIVRALIVRSWFWLSPVLYTIENVPEEWRNLYFLNPLAVVVEGLRWAFTQTPMPPAEAWAIGGTSAALILVVGYLYFRRQEPWFADLT